MKTMITAMNFRIFVVGATAALVSAAPAMATTTNIKCIGYTIALSDDLVIEGQVMTGSPAAFEKIVCERSRDYAADVENATITVIPIFVESLGMSTRVVIFKHGKKKSSDN